MTAECEMQPCPFPAVEKQIGSARVCQWHWEGYQLRWSAEWRKAYRQEAEKRYQEVGIR